MKPGHHSEQTGKEKVAKPGLRSPSWFLEEQKYLAPGVQRIAQLSRLVLSYGQGCWLVDMDGRRYLDFFAGVGVASLGHSHPHFLQSVREQLERLVVGSFTTRTRVRLLRLLAEISPVPTPRIQLYSGGAEAVEAALRLAKAYTKKFEVVGFWGGFHGKTGGVLGLVGDSWKQGWGPLYPGTHLVPYADCYRCPFRLEYPGCGMFCLDFARQAIRRSSAGAVAAVLVEPMQGTAGNVVPPPEFLPGVAEIARELNAVLVCDEMITGFGRTGKMFACEHTATVPDVITIGKGVGNGFPVSGLIAREEMANSEPFAKPSSSSSSYGGNPLAASAALATVETIVAENLAANAARVGAVLLNGLRSLQEKYPFIGDVRGRGLFLGLDFVKDRRTKEPLPAKLTEQFFLAALRRGLLVMGYFPRVRINPPLTLTEDEARAGVAILDEACREIAPLVRGLV